MSWRCGEGPLVCGRRVDGVVGGGPQTLLQLCVLVLVGERLDGCVTAVLVEGGEHARAKVSEASPAMARLVRV